jgi:polyribonucleotide nucleotidyltransferase
MDDYELSDDGSVNDDPENTTNDWQCVQNNKKRKITKTQPTKSTNFHISQQNRFESLANADENTKESVDVQQHVNPKPPPIFVHGVTDYPKMIQALEAIVEAEQYKTKAMTNNVIKINVNTTETYRTVVRFMKDSNIIYHTYQLKEDKPYKVVLRNLHHSIPVEDIKEDLQKEGFKVRNITNITHRVTKLPLPLSL